MADDITISPIGTPYPVVTDELAGARHVQVMKNAYGANGLLTFVEDATPLPVASRVALPAAARLQQIWITTNVAGTTVLFVGTPGQTIRLFRMWLVVSGDVGLTFLDGANPFHPTMPLVANGSWVLDFDSDPWFVTSPGNALGLSLTAAVQVSGLAYCTKG